MQAYICSILPARLIDASQNRRVKLSSATPFTPTYVKDHIARSADREFLYKSRVLTRQVVLEDRVQIKQEREAQRLKRKARRDAAISSARYKRQNSLWHLSPAETRFELFLPLHSLWMGYMSELLALPPAPSTPINSQAASMAAPSAASMHAKLVKADFNGSLLTVRQSKNPCLVGLSGIVVHETENSFKVVTKKDQLKLIPKQNSIFTFAVPLFAASSTASISSSAANTGGAASDSAEGCASANAKAIPTVLDLPHIEFELYGNQFCYRAVERAGRKFKPKETIEL
ncbi:RNase P/MRP, p29 subunit [Laetiporus sulphureus 93-53]|uniref:Ribonuclease P protein subunit n=1 Tax=Laetiporus sulphureus 93-53 TaxID=1314785 RepID=A0A165H8J4_9APHY|nr:RNase P/MRP, p29 subunit [Laetiporus sulphureus 93-53]KZT11392.1 RNase P/MRP, p29 subunit [Laetiporus sulphureus 93-53]